MVVRMNHQASGATTTPNEPKYLPSEFSLGARKKGEVAVAPPNTRVASSAPGMSGRRPIFPRRR
jgi:hypothetical protein